MKNEDIRAIVTGRSNPIPRVFGNRTLAAVKDYMVAKQTPAAQSSSNGPYTSTQDHPSSAPSVLESAVLLRLSDLPEQWLIGSSPISVSTPPITRPGVHVLPHPNVNLVSAPLDDVVKTFSLMQQPVADHTTGEEFAKGLASMHGGATPAIFRDGGYPASFGTIVGDVAQIKGHDSLLGGGIPQSNQQQPAHLTAKASSNAVAPQHRLLIGVEPAKHAETHNAAMSNGPNQARVPDHPGSLSTVRVEAMPSAVTTPGDGGSQGPSSDGTSQASANKPDTLVVVHEASPAYARSTFEGASLPPLSSASTPAFSAEAAPVSMSGMAAGINPEISTAVTPEVGSETGPNIATGPGSAAFPTEPATAYTPSGATTSPSDLGPTTNPVAQAADSAAPRVGQESSAQEPLSGAGLTTVSATISNAPVSPSGTTAPSTSATLPHFSPSSQPSMSIPDGHPRHNGTPSPIRLVNPVFASGASPPSLGTPEHPATAGAGAGVGVGAGAYANVGGADATIVYGQAGPGPAAILATLPSVANAIQAANASIPAGRLLPTTEQLNTQVSFPHTTLNYSSMLQHVSPLTGSTLMNDGSDPAHNHAQLHVHH